MSEDKYYLKTLGNAFSILNIFQEQTKPLTIAEIVELSGLDRATVNRIVYTMTQDGYLIKKEKKYGLSGVFLLLSNAYLNSFTILQPAQDEVDHLAYKFGEMVSLFINYQNKHFMIYYREPQNASYHRSQMGQTMPRNCTSVGKVFLSQYSDEEIRTIMDKEDFFRSTEKSICDIETLLEDIHLVQKRGYASCMGEYTLDSGALAVPIFNDSGEIIMAVNFSFGREMTDERLKEIIPELLAIGNRLSAKMGHLESIYHRYLFF